jgi:hypothetical protein
MTEFDWAQRADGSFVAVVSPEIPQSGEPPSQPGCWAVNLNLVQGTTNPFPSLVAEVSDQDATGPSGSSEVDGPAGCTYDPTSNTGIVIVRRLENTHSYQLYSLIDSGVMP